MQNHPAWKSVWGFGLSLFLLILWGIVTLYGSREFLGEGDALWRKQLLSLTAGGIVFFLTIRYWDRLRGKPLQLLGLGMLAALWAVPFAGEQIHGMRGWYRIGIFSLQPSELGKLFFLTGLPEIFRRFSRERAFGVSLLWTVLWTLPILLQPDLGTAAVYWGVFFCLSFVRNVRLRSLLLSASAAMAVIAGYLLAHPYAMERLKGFRSWETSWRDSAWHLLQCRLAIHSGSWTGVKMGGTFWSRHYLPLPHNDSIFALICETTGVLGAVLTIALYLLPGYYLCRMLRKDAETDLLVSGTLFFLLLQALLHMGVNAGLLPATGVPLPLISAGGSSLTGTLLLCGACAGSFLASSEKITPQTSAPEREP